MQHLTPDGYLTMDEASEAYGIPLSVLADAIRSKQLAAYVHDADQSAAIPKPALEEWARRREHQSTAEIYVAGRWLSLEQAAALVGTTPQEIGLSIGAGRIPVQLERAAVHQWWEQAVRGTLDEVGGRR